MSTAYFIQEPFTDEVCFRCILKLSTVGQFLSSPFSIRKFHKLVDAITKLLDPYLSVFSGGTVTAQSIHKDTLVSSNAILRI